jgi:hypothetical protein
MSQTTAPQDTGTKQVNAGATVSPVSLGYYPSEGSKACSLQYNFSALLHYYEDLQMLKAYGIETSIQAIWIDNSSNSQSVTIIIAGSNQQIIVPAYYQGVFPVFFSDNAAFYISVAAVGGVCKVCLLNVPVNSAGIWSSTGTQLVTNLNGSGVAIQPLIGTQAFNVSSYGGGAILIPSVAGKRFFITAINISVSQDATASTAGINSIGLYDSSGLVCSGALYMPTVGVATFGLQTVLSLSGFQYITPSAGSNCGIYVTYGFTNGNYVVTAFGGYTTQTP